MQADAAANSLASLLLLLHLWLLAAARRCMGQTTFCCLSPLPYLRRPLSLANQDDPFNPHPPHACNPFPHKLVQLKGDANKTFILVGSVSANSGCGKNILLLLPCAHPFTQSEDTKLL
jgi:hypothetical protein